MPESLLFETDNGEVFNVKLKPGICFGMCLDAAKVQLDHFAKAPRLNELTPGKWAIIQSAHELAHDGASDDAVKAIIEAQGLKVAEHIPRDSGYDDPIHIAGEIISYRGVNICSIFGKGRGHTVLWVRDYPKNVYRFLDPNTGLWSFDNIEEAGERIRIELSRYERLGLLYEFDCFKVTLS